MKIMAYFCSVILAAYTLLSCFPLSGEEEIYDNMIRLHVIAQSDSEAHQAEKREVRDAILECLAAQMEDCPDFDTACLAVRNMIPAITEASRTVTDTEVTVTLGKETYPVREYEDFTLPAGEYTSLRVVLGEGEGQNWWCVLFPRLCTTRAAKDTVYEDFIAAGFTPEQYRLIKKESGVKYKVRFKILEILSGWMK